MTNQEILDKIITCREKASAARNQITDAQSAVNVAERYIDDLEDELVELLRELEE